MTRERAAWSWVQSGCACAVLAANLVWFPPAQMKACRVLLSLEFITASTNLVRHILRTCGERMLPPCLLSRSPLSTRATCKTERWARLSYLLAALRVVAAHALWQHENFDSQNACGQGAAGGTRTLLVTLFRACAKVPCAGLCLGLRTRSRTGNGGGAFGANHELNSERTPITCACGCGF